MGRSIPLKYGPPLRRRELNMGYPSRRTFLKGGAVVAGAQLLPRQVRGAASATDAVTTKLQQFDYGDVQLLEGPMREQFDRNHALFLALSDDSLLKPFRQRAGLAAPGEDMGGWYSWSKDFDPPHNMTGYIPGHSFGQYLSGLARAYAVTGDAATRQKIHGLVEGFGKTVTEKFYVDYPLPAYTFDKTNCGLIDAHQFAGDPMALPVLDHATQAVLPYLPEKALSRQEMEARPHLNIAFTWDESYTLPENFFLAYKRSGNPRYKQLAARFLEDDTYFDPLAEGKNVLPGLHAYSHVNALCSASQAYLVLKSEKHLRAARNGFDFVLTTQSFATGGWGPNEEFRVPGSGDLAASLEKTHSSFETPCGAYGHFKVARYLMRVTGDSRYGDSMERVLYNTILGAKPLRPDGTSFYYSDYNNNASKFYYEQKWPCCSGTFPQVTADYGISSYFRVCRRRLCQLVCSFARKLASGRGALFTGTADALSALAGGEYSSRRGAAGEVYDLSPRAKLGWKQNLDCHQRQELCGAATQRFLRGCRERVEGRRPHRVRRSICR